MKKLILTAVLVGALCGGAAAQTSYCLGAKVGGGMAKVNISGSDMVPGFDGGVFVEIKLGSFSIQPEILYTMKGMKFKQSILGYAAELEWKFNYLEIPILIKKTMNTESSMKPTFFAGPTVSFLMSAKESFTNNVVPDLNYSDEDVKDAFKSTDICLAVGAGIDFDAGQSGKVILDLRFTISLTDILDSREELDQVIIGTGSMRNWNLTFMVGYGFDLGKKAEAAPEEGR
jgi:opacity protein-like surface antigen